VKGPPWQRNPPQVGLDHADEWFGAESPAQPACQRGIKLDGDDPRSGPRQWRRERAEPSAEVKDEIAVADAAGADKLADQWPVNEEVRAGWVRRGR